MGHIYFVIYIVLFYVLQIFHNEQSPNCWAETHEEQLV